MTSESKENLMKIITNAPAETPGTNISTFTNKGETSQPNDADPLVRDQIQWQGYTIGLTGTITEQSPLYVYDSQGNLVLKQRALYKGVECDFAAIDIDENGNLYGLIIYDNDPLLAYFYNPFVKNADGQYELTIKTAYNIKSDIQDMFNTIGGNGTLYDMDLKKSPIDSRFLITWAFNDNVSAYNLVTILYHVNVGVANEYEYRYGDIGTDIPVSYKRYAWIKNVKATWTETNVNFSIITMVKDYTLSAAKAGFYQVTGNFTEDSVYSTTTLLEVNNYKETVYGTNNKYHLGKNAVQTDNNIYFVINNVVSEGQMATAIISVSDRTWPIWSETGVESMGYVNLVKINNQVFAGALICTRLEPEGGGYTPYMDYYFMHIVDETTNVCEVETDSITTIGEAIIIQNYFNLYKIFIEYSLARYTLLYTYKNGYNGIPYFSDDSLISENMQLYDDSGEIAFDRNLYDKQLTGNVIASITQIPFNYLNDVIISQEKLKSKNNNIIDENNEEIEKNQYEEIIISNLDQIRVFNNNNGSTYNSNCSLKLAKNIYNGFAENYKLKKYRVNYANSHVDYDIKNVTRVGNEAIIDMYVYNAGVKNVELYDENFSVPFVTIDITNYEQNKIYKLTQKVKVE